MTKSSFTCFLGHFMIPRVFYKFDEFYANYSRWSKYKFKSILYIITKERIFGRKTCCIINFGKIISGMKVFREIENVKVKREKPVKPIKIVSCSHETVTEPFTVTESDATD